MQQLEAKPQAAPALFVYIPFCKTICTYCDFSVYAHLAGLFESYAEAVAVEIATVARQLPGPRVARSLAFGGGTPSILSPRLLGVIFQAVYDSFELQAGSEITLEANPGTVDLAGLRVLRGLGVNRLSLGVQSFEDGRLKALNRNHSAAASRQAFDNARTAGLDNINLDLLFGLPDQTLEQWEATLAEALTWQPEHLSLYALQVEAGTALARQIAKGRVTQPDPDLAAEMYLLAEDMLSAAGYRHYEISNYARPGFESRHNLVYWQNRPYLGFGAGAHSYFAGERYANLNNPPEYVARLKAGAPVVASREPISRELEIGETLMLGLRLDEGIALRDFQSRFGVELRELFGPTIDQLVEWELMQADNQRIQLTARGRLVSNQVLWRFLPDSEPAQRIR